jgi:tetratricopeptide (TPR) repeat protein
MLAGDLDTAAREFERAIEVSRRSTRDPRSLALALFGAAVALDRLGEHTTAIERAREAVAMSGGGVSVLRSEGVFFEPAHELHYYLGIGHLAIASDANEPWRRRQALEWAEQAFSRFLDDGGESGPYGALARRHADEARTALAAAGTSDADTRARRPRARP